MRIMLHRQWNKVIEMNRAEKTDWAKTFKENLEKSQAVIFADYKGLTAVQADEFRKVVRDRGGYVRVVKNNIARIATKDGSLGEGTKAVADKMVGPTLAAFAFQDAAAVAKAIQDFAKDNEALVIKESLMDGKEITPAEVEALASLPSREELLSMLLSVMNGPARDFVSVLAAVPRGLVNVLSAIKDKKEAEGA